MITKIKSINNFAVFNNFDWDTSVLDKSGQPLKFRRINVFYGRNYSGKTTLSRIFRALETQQAPEKYDNPQFEVIVNDGTSIKETTLNNNLDVRVFNQDFVKTNLRFLIDPDDEIAPFAILGADNTQIERDIEDLEIEIGSDADNLETGLNKDLKEAEETAKNSKDKYNTTLNDLETKLSDKATNRQTGIKYNAVRYNEPNYNIAKIKQDIQTVTDKAYIHLSEDKRSEHERIILEQEKSDIKGLNVPTLSLGDFCKNAENLLSRKIGDSNKIQELLLDTVLNEWVKQGKKIHEGKEVCAFCGNHISTERWEVIHSHFDEESKDLEDAIDILLSKVNSEKIMLQTKDNIDKSLFYANFHQQIDELSKKRNEQVQQYCNSLDNIADKLKQRKVKITVPIKFVAPQNNSALLAEVYADYNVIVKNHNDFTKKLSSSKEASQKALKLQEIADFCSAIDYTARTDRISKLEIAMKSDLKDVGIVMEKLKSKKQQLQDKRRQLNDEEEGAKLVNKYLNDYFGHNSVSLEAENVTEGEKRIKFQIMRDGKPAYNLSEGECSLISFCYFIAKLDDIETKDKKPIIYIDDPVSSLDSNHIYFVYSLIVATIAKTGNFDQLFVSTHNLDFLKYLKRLKSYELNDKNQMVAVPKQLFISAQIAIQ